MVRHCGMLPSTVQPSVIDRITSNVRPVLGEDWNKKGMVKIPERNYIKTGGFVTCFKQMVSRCPVDKIGPCDEELYVAFWP